MTPTVSFLLFWRTRLIMGGFYSELPVTWVTLAQFDACSVAGGCMFLFSEQKKGPPVWSRQSYSFVEPGLERSQDLVQQVDDLLQRAAEPAVQQVGDRAQQVAEQIAGTGLSSDVEHDLIQVDHQAQQIQVKRTERQMKDVAGSIQVRDRQREWCRDVLHRAGRSVSHRGDQSS